jgi:hypothetical protein
MNCKNLGINPCVYCAGQVSPHCYISWFDREFRNNKMDKDELIRWIRYSTSHRPQNILIYMAAALKHGHVELYDMYQKLVILL